MNVMMDITLGDKHINIIVSTSSSYHRLIVVIASSSSHHRIIVIVPSSHRHRLIVIGIGLLGGLCVCGRVGDLDMSGAMVG